MPPDARGAREVLSLLDRARRADLFVRRSSTALFWALAISSILAALYAGFLRP